MDRAQTLDWRGAQAPAHPPASAALPAAVAHAADSARRALRLRRLERVAAVEDLVRANRAGRMGFRTICAKLDVSHRALHDAFTTICGKSPSRHLLQRRLDWAREALLRAPSGATRVKCVAIAHGFNHLGRFAAAYRARFGESPSCTLARAAAACAP